MRVLITGIEGFVAPFLAKILHGKHEVFGTYFLEPKRDLDIEYVHMDLCDKEEVEKVIMKVKPDVIYHLAGFSSVAESWRQPEMAMKVNAQGTENLLNAVVKARLNPKILIVSSSGIYGPPRYIPIDEKHPLYPEGPYALSRVEQEKIIAQFKNLHIVIARSFNHTGPGQEPKFVCSSFAYQVAMIEKDKVEPVIKHGNLDVRRDFSDVRDIVRAYELLAEKGKAHEVYNVCSGKAYSLREILDTLISMSTKEVKKEIDESKIRPKDINLMQGDNRKLVDETGWKPEIDLKHTLKEILEFWRNKL